MLRCNRELLSRYKDGEVTLQEQRELEAHLSSCPDCAATLAAYYSIGRSIAGLTGTTASASLRAGLFARVAGRNGPGSQGSLFRSFLSGLALAATAAILILVLSMFFRGMSDTTTMVQATAVYPPLGASDIPPASFIEVRFNKPMDTKSVEESVAITPAVSATIAWEGEKLIVKPVPGLAANTGYTITIGGKAKDVQGTPIKEPMVLHFNTGGSGVFTATATLTLVAVTSPTFTTPTATATPGATTATPTSTVTSTLTVTATLTATPSPTVTVPLPLPSPRLVLVDPRSPSTIFLAMSTGVLYKSTDGGTSWRLIGSGLPVAAYALNDLAIDPQVGQVLYAATSQGAFRSGDGGETWSPINNGLPAGAPAGKPSVQTLVIHPINRQILHAGLPSGTSPATVYRSLDSGTSWTPVSSINADGAASPLGPDSLVFLADTPSTLFAATANGVFVSEDAGSSWAPANRNLVEPIVSLAVSPKDRSVLYAATKGGIYKTSRSSIDWQKLNPGSGTDAIRALAVSPDGALYLSLGAAESGGRRATARRSGDGGNSWSAVQGGLENTEPVAFAFDPSNARTVYATTLGGLFKSADGGSRWSPLSLAVVATPTPVNLPGTPVATATPIPTPREITTTTRIGYVYDPAVGANYNGDWLTHLRSRGYAVTPLDIHGSTGFDPEGYDLIVVTWLVGQLPEANVAKLQAAKAPVLNAYAPLVEELGQGKVYDAGNPGRTVYGKTITVEPGGGALTAGHSGEVTVANDTLYRVPIIPTGAVLATVTDESMGVRNAPVWTTSENNIYFGYWYSKDGTNHNDAYWTFFDRSVDYLLGRLQLPSASPTPRAADK